MTTGSNNKLYVHNVIEKALFVREIEGQISDGMWENARPFGHWEAWSINAENIIIDPLNVGRNFHAMKSNYSINSSELRDCVGDRMVFYAHFVKVLEFYKGTSAVDEWLSEYSSFDSFDEIEKIYIRGINDKLEADYQEKLYQFICKYDIFTAEFRANFDNMKFEMKDLCQSLASLRKAMMSMHDDSKPTHSEFRKPVEKVEELPSVATVELATSTVRIADVAVEPKKISAKIEPKTNFAGGAVAFEGRGWYHTSASGFWTKVNKIDHFDKAPMAYIEESDLF